MTQSSSHIRERRSGTCFGAAIYTRAVMPMAIDFNDCYRIWQIDAFACAHRRGRCFAEID